MLRHIYVCEHRNARLHTHKHTYTSEHQTFTIESETRRRSNSQWHEGEWNRTGAMASEATAMKETEWRTNWGSTDARQPWVTRLAKERRCKAHPLWIIHDARVPMPLLGNKQTKIPRASQRYLRICNISGRNPKYDNTRVSLSVFIKDVVVKQTHVRILAAFIQQRDLSSCSPWKPKNTKGTKIFPWISKQEFRD